jgi:SAM-dependent methyltransferase
VAVIPHLPPDDERMSALVAATADAERTHFWFRGFRRFVTPLLAAAARGRRDLIIADCGAGTGHNLGLLEPFGALVLGVELNRTGAMVARARGERRMIRGTVTALPIRTGTIDLATSFDVLYCLPDAAERAALDEMRRVLKPGARVVINVAANPRLAGQHSELTHEVRRYTRASLAAALTRAGFTTLRATYTNATTFPLVAAVRTLQRRGLMRGAGDRARDIQIPTRPVNAALTAALAAEAGLLRLVDMPFGSSLLVLAERD